MSCHRLALVVALLLSSAASVQAGGADCAALTAPTGSYEVVRNLVLDRAGTHKEQSYVQRVDRNADGSYDLAYTVDEKAVRNHFVGDFMSTVVETGTFKTLASYDPMPNGSIFTPGNVVRTTRYTTTQPVGKSWATEQVVTVGDRKTVTYAGCTFEAFDVVIDTRNTDPAIKPALMKTTGDYIPALHIALTARSVSYTDAEGSHEDAVSRISSGEVSAK